MKRKDIPRFIESVRLLRETADDKTASMSALAYPTLKRNGALIKSGMRILWGGRLKRAASDLWDTTENDPDHAPTLWEDISYRDGIRIIPQTITAGLAFSMDEKGWWNGSVYTSLLNANTWTPEQYPAGWRTEDE